MSTSMAVSGGHTYRERECLHRGQGVEGCFYSGASYVQSLQRLRASAAAYFAARVSSFFWSDARQVIVWLCHDCAAELSSLRPAA
jgi:hypothetical protein